MQWSVIFGGSWVCLLAQKVLVLAEIFHCFPYFFLAEVRVVHYLHLFHFMFQ